MLLLFLTFFVSIATMVGWFVDSYWSWLFTAAVTIAVFVVAEADNAADVVVSVEVRVPLFPRQQLLLPLLRLLNSRAVGVDASAAASEAVAVHAASANAVVTAVTAVAPLYLRLLRSWLLLKLVWL